MLCTWWLVCLTTKDLQFVANYTRLTLEMYRNRQQKESAGLCNAWHSEPLTAQELIRFFTFILQAVLHAITFAAFSTFAQNAKPNTRWIKAYVNKTNCTHPSIYWKSRVQQKTNYWNMTIKSCLVQGWWLTSWMSKQLWAPCHKCANHISFAILCC